MGIPIQQALKVGFYVTRQKMKGKKKYPLVLMLEPLFRCNLECIGCGKIQKPNEILKQHLTVEQCLNAARECNAPVVSIAGGEPLMHPNIVEVVEGLIAQGRYIYLCTNALLLDDFLGKLPVSSQLVLSIHLDGLEEEHDRIAAQPGTFKIAVDAVKKAKSLGYRVTSNSTFFEGTTVDQVEEFLDYLKPLGIDAMTVASTLSYPRRAGSGTFLRSRQHAGIFPRTAFTQQKRTLGFQPFPALHRIPQGQQGLRLHALGQSKLLRPRLAETLLPARRGIRRELSGIDGHHRMGTLWTP